MRAAAPTCQDIGLTDRRDGPRRAHPPRACRGSPRRGSHRPGSHRPGRVHPAGHLALGPVASFCGCAGAAHAPAVSPKPLVAPGLRPPPRQAGSRPRAGREAAAPAQPPILIRAVTLLLGSRVTLVRGARPRAEAKPPAAAGGDIDPPSGAVVVGAAGQFVTPRLFDAHSHLGVYPTPGAVAHLDGSERQRTGTRYGAGAPQAQFADAFWPQDPGIERAVAGGVTTIQVLSGSGNLIGACAVTMEVRPVPRQMLVTVAPGGLKVASGENPNRSYGEDKRAPGGRHGQPRSPAGDLSRDQEAPDGLGATPRRGVAPDCDRGEGALARDDEAGRATPQPSSRRHPRDRGSLTSGAGKDFSPPTAVSVP